MSERLLPCPFCGGELRAARERIAALEGEVSVAEHVAQEQARAVAVLAEAMLKIARTLGVEEPPGGQMIEASVISARHCKAVVERIAALENRERALLADIDEAVAIARHHLPETPDWNHERAVLDRIHGTTVIDGIVRYDAPAKERVPSQRWERVPSGLFFFDDEKRVLAVVDQERGRDTSRATPWKWEALPHSLVAREGATSTEVTAQLAAEDALERVRQEIGAALDRR